jgi:hypothetical protein
VAYRLRLSATSHDLHGGHTNGRYQSGMCSNQQTPSSQCNHVSYHQCQDSYGLVVDASSLCTVSLAQLYRPGQQPWATSRSHRLPWYNQTFGVNPLQGQTQAVQQPVTGLQVPCAASNLKHHSNKTYPAACKRCPLPPQRNNWRVLFSLESIHL